MVYQLPVMENCQELEKLTEEMRKRAKDIHEKSNALVNMKLVFVLTDKALWAEVVFQFYNVFKTIEHELERLSDHPVIKPLLIDGLFRAKRFEKIRRLRWFGHLEKMDESALDIEFYIGKDWIHYFKLWEPTVVYMAKIREAAERDPVLLVSYVHTMYLALFGGGKIIGKAITKAFGLKGDDGVLGLSFEESGKVKVQLVDALNSLPLDTGTREAIFEEKKKIFEMNNAIIQKVNPTYQSYRNFSCWLLKYTITIFLIIFLLYRLFRVIFVNLSDRQKVSDPSLPG